MRDDRPRVAVVDCQLGNLASVTWACEAVGLTARPTHDPDDLVDADAVILPGVGAFGEAMRRLDELGLVAGLRSVAASVYPDDISGLLTRDHLDPDIPPPAHFVVGASAPGAPQQSVGTAAPGPHG